MKKSMGKPYAGKLHVRFEEGAGRGESSLPLYSTFEALAYCAFGILIAEGFDAA